ncbi:hypothetical protein QL203_16900 [Cronobacter malonaticus]|uniref:hypothetical protein n=1 Tax=Cronobacter malonaticus TaxID=413503 RepID=UPI000518FB16|nr:hypothetical protein [Cronobacter malonaticus]MDI6469446.1 hypothetical protein [Cronobacter malonaticus]
MIEISNEKIQWLHDAATEFASTGMKMTMNPDEVLQLTTPLLALRKEREAAVPVYQCMDDGKWYDTEKRLYDEVKENGNECRVLYTAPPAQPVAVPDEHYQNLSELYHAQEKRLFKLAQRIKGHAFDKYSHSSSQAIDVLEAAIFGESDEAFRAAMLAAPGKQPLSVDVLAGALRNAPLAPSDSQGRQREKYAAIPLATDEDHWYLVSWCSPGGRYGSTEIHLNRPWSKGSMRSATKMIADYNDLEHANVVILSVFPIAAPQSTN